MKFILVMILRTAKALDLDVPTLIESTMPRRDCITLLGGASAAAQEGSRARGHF
jgi:hypothetical protein